MAMSRSLAGTWLTTRPSIESVPDVIDSSPAIMRSVVVLPQPDGPSSTMNSPSADLERHVVGRRRMAAVVDLGQLVERYDCHDALAHFTAPAVMPWISFSEKKA